MQITPTFFPALDAVLNGSSAVLIGSGLYFIKRGRERSAQAYDAGRLRHLDVVPDFVPLLSPGAARRSDAFPGSRA